MTPLLEVEEKETQFAGELFASDDGLDAVVASDDGAEPENLEKEPDDEEDFSDDDLALGAEYDTEE